VGRDYKSRPAKYFTDNTKQKISIFVTDKFDSTMNKKLIRFDWAVKKLLRNKANFGVLEGFLSELLFDDIRIEKILESEGNQETEDDKFNRVDILTQNSKNELIIIEIQNTYEIDYFQRMAYGLSLIHI
jgi:hypothetical protein